MPEQKTLRKIQMTKQGKIKEFQKDIKQKTVDKEIKSEGNVNNR